MRVVSFIILQDSKSSRDAIGPCKSPIQKNLVLWRAFMALLSIILLHHNPSGIPNLLRISCTAESHFKRANVARRSNHAHHAAKGILQKHSNVTQALTATAIRRNVSYQLRFLDHISNFAILVHGHFCLIFFFFYSLQKNFATVWQWLEMTLIHNFIFNWTN